MASRYYTSGFTGSAGVVLVTRERAIIAADFRYTEQAERASASGAASRSPRHSAGARNGSRSSPVAGDRGEARRIGNA
ncbi:MAG: aminopeptidase P family N-terminal domain-containing protein [Dehalococcoidia bacterium]|nr:aminopeptidase P family N-terminal domain-containing protein [Dehalococcoidia bacterium]